MPVTIAEITSYDDFATIGPVEFEAYDKPLNSFWEILKGPSVEECTRRYWAWHESTPGSHWIKATDADTGEVLGASEWIVHDRNPYDKPQPTPQATWWPEGSLQDIGNQFLEKFFGERPRRMDRPHVLINIFFVSQNNRRRGVGRKMMEWGCKLADSLGMDSFVEASQIGTHIYAAFGFVSVGHIFLTAENERPTTEWSSLYEQILPAPFRVEIMWRPKDGQFEPGKTECPWAELLPQQRV